MSQFSENSWLVQFRCYVTGEPDQFLPRSYMRRQIWKVLLNYLRPLAEEWWLRTACILLSVPPGESVMEEWWRQRRGGVYVKRLVTGPLMTAMTAGEVASGWACWRCWT